MLMQVEQAAPRTAPARVLILPPTAPARRARDAQARAAYDGTVAVYRQTVLAVFQDVEDQLVAPRILAPQGALPRDAVTEQNRAEASTLNQYEARLITDTDMVTAQATARNARAVMCCRPGSTGKAAPGADLAIGRSMVAQRSRSGTSAVIALVRGRISRSFRASVEFVRPAQHRQL